MKLTFIGAAHEVTGSCHLLQAAGKNILIDCGMEQGPDLCQNQDFHCSGRSGLCIFDTCTHRSFRSFAPLCRMDLRADIDHLPQRIYVTLCFVTARIFRNLKLNGATGKEDVPECRSLSRFM